MLGSSPSLAISAWLQKCNHLSDLRSLHISCRLTTVFRQDDVCLQHSAASSPAWGSHEPTEAKQPPTPRLGRFAHIWG